MSCEWLEGPGGSIIHINRGRGRRKPCPFCKTGAVSKLCDYPVGNGKTCDAEICDRCTSTLGRQTTEYAPGFKRLNDTIDVCPLHKGKPFPPEENHAA